MLFHKPTKNPTPEEGQVLVYLFVFGLLFMGCLMLWISGKLPTEKAETAHELWHNGWYCLGGSAIAFSLWRWISQWL